MERKSANSSSAKTKPSIGFENDHHARRKTARIESGAAIQDDARHDSFMKTPKSVD
jgi:hypothetical protein